MSMKKSINTIIRTKLQEGLEEQEEIGVVTPANPKVPSTGEPPEPDPGMLPPGPKKITGSKPTSPESWPKIRLNKGTPGRVAEEDGS